jgi:hypothetical protein
MSKSLYDELEQVVLTKFRALAAKLQQEFPDARVQVDSRDQSPHSLLAVWLEVSPVKSASGPREEERVVYFGVQGNEADGFRGGVDFSTGAGEIIADGPTLENAHTQLDQSHLEIYGNQLQAFLDEQTAAIEQALTKQ